MKKINKQQVYRQLKMPTVQLTMAGLNTLNKIFMKGNIDSKLFKKVIKDIRKYKAYDCITKKYNITLPKIYKIAGKYSVLKNKTIFISNPPRNKGRRNFSKWDKVIDSIITSLNNGESLTEMSKSTKVSSVTLHKYLFMLLFFINKKYITAI